MDQDNNTAAVPGLLPLQGAMNFRDMGGVRTTDGRTVKQGMLFRAAELTGLTPADMALLNRYHLRTVFDYRNDVEAAAHPDPVIAGAQDIRVPVNPEIDVLSAASAKEPTIEDFYQLFSRDMFIKMYGAIPLHNPSYQRLMALLAEPAQHLPLVHHCAGGRDRTGVGAMLIYLTLGVPFETVLADYLESNVALQQFHQEKLDLIAARGLTSEQLAQFKDVFLLQEPYLRAALDAILDRYGNFETYLLVEFGIDAQIRRHIKDFCLE